MPDLPARPDLNQLRHQARDLLRAAQRGGSGAVARIRAVSGRIILSSAQLALAREYGFASWARVKLEVERRDILNSRDLFRLTRLLAEHPELATTEMEHWSDRQRGEPLGYITMMRFNHDPARAATRASRHRRHRQGARRGGRAPVAPRLGKREGHVLAAVGPGAPVEKTGSFRTEAADPSSEVIEVISANRGHLVTEKISPSTRRAPAASSWSSPSNV